MFKNYYGAYAINLEENTDRKEAFIKEWNDLDPKLKFVEGIDTRLHLWKYYKKYLSKEAIAELKETIKNKKRKTHDALTEGAIGCYLSHMKCWEKFLKECKDKNKYCLILEDDSSVPKNLIERMDTIVKNIKDKWGVILLGWMATSQYLPYNKHLYIPDTFQLCHAYMLSYYGAKTLLKLHDKIEMQVDHFMSKNIKKIKIFGTIDDICVQKNSCGYTNIQNYQV